MLEHVVWLHISETDGSEVNNIVQHQAFYTIQIMNATIIGITPPYVAIKKLFICVYVYM